MLFFLKALRATAFLIPAENLSEQSPQTFWKAEGSICDCPLLLSCLRSGSASSDPFFTAKDALKVLKGCFTDQLARFSIRHRVITSSLIFIWHASTILEVSSAPPQAMIWGGYKGALR